MSRGTYSKQARAFGAPTQVGGKVGACSRQILGVVAILLLAGCDDALSVAPANPGSGMDDPTWTEGDGGVTDDGAEKAC